MVKEEVLGEVIKVIKVGMELLYHLLKLNQNQWWEEVQILNSQAGQRQLTIIQIKIKFRTKGHLKFYSLNWHRISLKEKVVVLSHFQEILKYYKLKQMALLISQTLLVSLIIWKELKVQDQLHQPSLQLHSTSFKRVIIII